MGIGISESQRLENYEHLTAVDLANAWAYATAYPAEIEAAIAANQAIA